MLADSENVELFCQDKEKKVHDPDPTGTLFTGILTNQSPALFTRPCLSIFHWPNLPAVFVHFCIA